MPPVSWLRTGTWLGQGRCVAGSDLDVSSGWAVAGGRPFEPRPAWAYRQIK